MSRQDAPPTDLHAKLGALGAERLAQFLAGLAEDDECVARKVELLLAPAGGSDAAKLLRKSIAGLKRRRGFVRYNESFAFGQELGALLDAVEEKLVRDHPATAVELLDEFLRTDGVVFEHADDSGGTIGGQYRHACALFADAASRLPGAPDLARRLEALLAEDAYGVRHHLLEHAVRFLPKEAIYELAEKWLQQAAAIPKNSPDDFARNGFLIKIQALAESVGDPQLYERVAFFDREAKGFPVVAMHVARQYLAANCAEEALQKLPSAPAVPEHFRRDYDEILAGIYRQLGRGEDLRALQWKMFCDAPSATSGADYLETLRATERPQAAERMRQQVRDGNYPPQQKALYFAEGKDLVAAADYVVKHPAAFDGGQYTVLLPLAEALEKPHPLAATLLYRRLIDAILARSLAKYYHHAVRYFRRLEKIADSVAAWGAAPTHADYTAALQAAHKRKRAFWVKLVGEKRGGAR